MPRLSPNEEQGDASLVGLVSGGVVVGGDHGDLLPCLLHGADISYCNLSSHSYLVERSDVVVT